jgi:hypothetical protein
MRPFDYSSSAELFPTRNLRARRTTVGYRRFARAADAIKFAIEDLPPELLHGAHMEVNEERFDSGAIRRLYEDAAYPLPRRPAKAKPAVGPAKNGGAAKAAAAPSVKSAAKAPAAPSVKKATPAPAKKMRVPAE